ncbi:19283_t:CDS:2 [Cetraspora pellucida]|uniref:19283_t:CDS:1 n=1 Tax=Cetraspora pellucida TaxID=1433469 RepID=A0A9N9AI97_9GLOM|nr:19283_t:CDS:2 [Cetraspora pellucida]
MPVSDKSIFELGLEGQSPDILNSLKRDHDELKSLHQKFNTANSTNDRERIAKEILKGVGIHDKIETLVFYPALKDYGKETGIDYVKQSLSDHENVRSSLYELVTLLEDEGVDSQMFKNFLNQMMTDFIEHAEVEEKEIFKFCRKIFDDKKISELGRKLDEMRKSALSATEKEMVGETEELGDAVEAGEIEAMEEAEETEAIEKMAE